MPSSRSFDRREVVAFAVGVLVVSAGVGGLLVIDRTETRPAYTVTKFDTTYDTANDTLRITHVAGDTLCANETYVVIQRNDTRGTVTQAWVTENSRASGDGRCREVSVTDSFDLTDADLESGDRVIVVWRTDREVVPKDERRKILTEYVVDAENATDREPTAPA